MIIRASQTKRRRPRRRRKPGNCVECGMSHPDMYYRNPKTQTATLRKCWCKPCYEAISTYDWSLSDAPEPDEWESWLKVIFGE